jgi:hypothetical protein
MPRLTQLFNPSGMEPVKGSSPIGTQLIRIEVEEDCDSSSSYPTDTDITGMTMLAAKAQQEQQGKPKCKDVPPRDNPFPSDLFDEFIKATCRIEAYDTCDKTIGAHGNGAHGPLGQRDIFFRDLIVWYCEDARGKNATICAELRKLKFPDCVNHPTDGDKNYNQAIRLLELWLRGRYNRNGQLNRQPGESLEDWVKRVRRKYHGAPEPESTKDADKFWDKWLKNGGPTGP